MCIWWICEARLCRLPLLSIDRLIGFSLLLIIILALWPFTWFTAEVAAKIPCLQLCLLLRRQSFGPSRDPVKCRTYPTDNLYKSKQFVRSAEREPRAKTKRMTTNPSIHPMDTIGDRRTNEQRATAHRGYVWFVAPLIRNSLISTHIECWVRVLNWSAPFSHSEKAPLGNIILHGWMHSNDATRGDTQRRDVAESSVMQASGSLVGHFHFEMFLGAH